MDHQDHPNLPGASAAQTEPKELLLVPGNKGLLSWVFAHPWSCRASPAEEQEEQEPPWRDHSGSDGPALQGSPQTQLSPAALAQDLGPSEGNAAVPKAQCATRLESGIRNCLRHGSMAE